MNAYNVVYSALPKNVTGDAPQLKEVFLYQEADKDDPANVEAVAISDLGCFYGVHVM